MSVKKGFFSVPIFLPVAVGILLLGAVLLLTDNGDVDVEAAKYYNIQEISAERTSGYYLGTVTNTTAVTLDDVINITAVNQSDPDPDDVLVISLNLTDGNGEVDFNTTLDLTYSGSNRDFYGDIILKDDIGAPLKRVSGGIQLNVSDGHTIRIKNYQTGVTHLMLKVDNAAPVMEPIEESTSVYRDGDKAYATNSATINLSLTDDDPLTTAAWAVTNQKVNYTWDSGIEQNWDGNPFSIPSTAGPHTLEVSSTDRFNQSVNVTFSYTVSNPLSGSISNSRSFENETVLGNSIRIVNGGSLDLMNSTLVIMGTGDEIVVDDGGYFNTTGLGTTTDENVSRIISSSDGMSITALPGSNLHLDDTIIVDSKSTSKKSTIQLWEGTIENSRIYTSNVGVWIRSQDVSVRDTNIIGDDGRYGIFVDVNHTYSDDLVELSGLEIDGGFDAGLRVANNSIWKPFDVDDAYYLENTNVSFTIPMVDNSYANPYLYFPHFLDSRSPEAKLSAWYNDSGVWKPIDGFPLSDEIRNNWTNGEDAKIDLSMIDTNENITFIFNATDGNEAVLYIGEAYIGSDSRPDLKLDIYSSEFKNLWLSKRVNDNTLLIEDIDISDSDNAFIEVHSSGMMTMEGIGITSESKGIEPEAEWIITSQNSAFDISDSDLEGYAGLSGFIYTDFSGQNDWPVLGIDNIEMKAEEKEIDTGILANTIRYQINNTRIFNVTDGIETRNSILNMTNSIISASEFGINLHIPTSYFKKIEMSMDNLSLSGDLEYAGLLVRGDITNSLDMVLSDLEISSNFDGDHSRNDGYGAITLDLASTRRAEIDIDNLNINTGPWHGLAVKDWPANGDIGMRDGTITGTDLDGIWLNEPVEINVERTEITFNDGWGLHGYEGSTVSIISVGDAKRNLINANEQGGLKIMEGTDLTITYSDIQNNKGPAIDMDEDVVADLENVELEGNHRGMISESGCNITLSKTVITLTSQGDGINIVDSDLIIRASESSTQITDNAGTGLRMSGGTLTIESLTVKDNTLHGIYLDDVEIQLFKSVKSQGNKGGSGLIITIDDSSLIDGDGNYATLSSTTFSENNGKGLTVVRGTSITETVNVDIINFRSYGNTGGDLIAKEDIHFHWRCYGRDRLGSENTTGFAEANLDITVEESGIEIFNEDITLLNDEAMFRIGELHTLRMENAYIKPISTDHTWYLSAVKSQNIEIKGGYLGYMGGFIVDDVLRFDMEGTLMSSGDTGIHVSGTKFDIDSCQFKDIEGVALRIQLSQGTISDSGFEDNERGILVDGLEGDLDIIGSSFEGNDWGIYVFKGNETDITVQDSIFDSNTVAPVWLSRNNMSIYNSDIDPERIIVNEIDRKVSIFYTLSVSLQDEEGDSLLFNADLKLGSSPSSIKVNDKSDMWTDTFKIYEVLRNGVDENRENAKLTLSYYDSTGSGKTMAYIEDEFILNTRTSKIYTGYMAPFTTSKFPTPPILQAEEDIGLKVSPVDISEWFSDIGNDDGNLTFSVQSLSKNITPILVDSMFSVDLAKDWNGEGSILVTATDPHGKSLSVNITIFVIGTNDPSFITNPRIVSSTGEDKIPRTGSTIEATWDWNDIDEGDKEAPKQYIRWYINGTLTHRYGTEIIDNSTRISDVREGQIWSFRVWPMDMYSYQTGGSFGESVLSPEIQVLGIAPKWKSDLTFNTNKPRTDQDIIVKPGTYEDVDTSVIVFNYQWESLNSNDKWVPIGAANSPILDSRYTKKGMDIRVKAWISDGSSTSAIKIATFEVVNSAPTIVSATITPEILDEKDDLVTITNIVSFDADGDTVTYFYNWSVGGRSIGVNREVPQLPWTYGGWIYPDKATISVNITPIDSENREGQGITLLAYLQPTDTDGDGSFDDINGDGENDPLAGDDTDDDNDGYLDEWEIELKTDPLNALSYPLDTDGDGIPDGNQANGFSWMDTDDDDDGILDSEDSYPKNGALPGDFDGDGIGDDKDKDIDGDGKENEKDYDPFNANVQSEPENDGQSLIEIFIFILVLLIVAVIIGVGYAIYTEKIKLPTNAPPSISGDDGAEAIFEEEMERPSKSEELDEMEELENMSVCSVCGELVQMDQDECPNCGAAFEDTEEMEED
jgi:rubrerythrin